MEKYVQIKEENKNSNTIPITSDKKNSKHSKCSLFFYQWLAGWLAFIATCCSVLCAHITVKNARYKLNVMGYVTECWSFKNDCINFDSKRSDSLTLRLIGVQLILHTHIHMCACACALFSICSNLWMRVLFASNTHVDTSHLVYFKLADFVRAPKLSRPIHHRPFYFSLGYIIR